jgi:hypothetical protein
MKVGDTQYASGSRHQLAYFRMRRYAVCVVVSARFDFLWSVFVAGVKRSKRFFLRDIYEQPAVECVDEAAIQGHSESQQDMSIKKSITRFGKRLSGPTDRRRSDSFGIGWKKYKISYSRQGDCSFNPGSNKRRKNRVFGLAAM